MIATRAKRVLASCRANFIATKVRNIDYWLPCPIFYLAPATHKNVRVRKSRNRERSDPRETLRGNQRRHFVISYFDIRPFKMATASPAVVVMTTDLSHA